MSLENTSDTAHGAHTGGRGGREARARPDAQTARADGDAARDAARPRARQPGSADSAAVQRACAHISLTSAETREVDGPRGERPPIYRKFERSHEYVCVSLVSHSAAVTVHCQEDSWSCILCVSHFCGSTPSWERYRRRRRRGRCLHHHLRRRRAPRPCGAPRFHSSHPAARGRRCYRRSRPRRGRARSAAWSL